MALLFDHNAGPIFYPYSQFLNLKNLDKRQTTCHHRRMSPRRCQEDAARHPRRTGHFSSEALPCTRNLDALGATCRSSGTNRVTGTSLRVTLLRNDSHCPTSARINPPMEAKKFKLQAPADLASPIGSGGAKECSQTRSVWKGVGRDRVLKGQRRRFGGPRTPLSNVLSGRAIVMTRETSHFVAGYSPMSLPGQKEATCFTENSEEPDFSP